MRRLPLLQEEGTITSYHQEKRASFLKGGPNWIRRKRRLIKERVRVMRRPALELGVKWETHQRRDVHKISRQASNTTGLMRQRRGASSRVQKGGGRSMRKNPLRLEPNRSRNKGGWLSFLEGGQSHRGSLLLFEGKGISQDEKRTLLLPVRSKGD